MMKGQDYFSQDEISILQSTIMMYFQNVMSLYHMSLTLFPGNDKKGTS